METSDRVLVPLEYDLLIVALPSTSLSMLSWKRFKSYIPIKLFEGP